MNAAAFPPVTVRPATAEDGPTIAGWWIVEQGGGIVALCPSELHARIIAEKLNAWFRS